MSDRDSQSSAGMPFPFGMGVQMMPQFYPQVANPQANLLAHQAQLQSMQYNPYQQLVGMLQQPQPQLQQTVFNPLVQNPLLGAAQSTAFPQIMAPPPPGHMYQYMLVPVPVPIGSQMPAGMMPGMLPFVQQPAAVVVPTTVKGAEESVIECTPVVKKNGFCSKRAFSIAHLLDQAKAVKTEPADEDDCDDTTNTTILLDATRVTTDASIREELQQPPLVASVKRPSTPYAAESSMSPASSEDQRSSSGAVDEGSKISSDPPAQLIPDSPSSPDHRQATSPALIDPRRIPAAVRRQQLAAARATKPATTTAIDIPAEPVLQLLLQQPERKVLPATPLSPMEQEECEKEEHAERSISSSSSSVVTTSAPSTDTVAEESAAEEREEEEEEKKVALIYRQASPVHASPLKSRWSRSFREMSDEASAAAQPSASSLSEGEIRSGESNESLVPKLEGVQQLQQQQQLEQTESSLSTSRTLGTEDDDETAAAAASASAESGCDEYESTIDGEEEEMEERVEKEEKKNPAEEGVAPPTTDDDEEDERSTVGGGEEEERGAESMNEEDIDNLLLSIQSKMREEEEKKEEEQAPSCHEITERPSIPPRFAVMRSPRSPEAASDKVKRPIVWNDDEECSRDGGRLFGPQPPPPPQMLQLQLLQQPEEEPQQERRRVNPYTVLLKNVQPKVADERLSRFLDGMEFGHWQLTRAYGQSNTTLRLKFRSRRDRDRALRLRHIVISRVAIDVEEEFQSSERSPSRKRKDSGRKDANEESGRRHSPIRVPSAEEMEAMRNEEPFHLETFKRRCNRHQIILTAGPIPQECATNRVIDYFRRQGSDVLDTPLRTARPREYLILAFPERSKPLKLLAQEKEHRVDGHVIAVHPPFDVHIQINSVSVTLADAVAAMLQDECGVVATLPMVRQRNASFSIGFLAFGRPQDAATAIKRENFLFMGGRVRVLASNTNESFSMFKDVWSDKQARAELTMQRALLKEKKREIARRKAEVEEEERREQEEEEEEERKRRMAKRRKRGMERRVVTDYAHAILTVGPIPESVLEETDETLLNNCSEVYDVPYEMDGAAHYRMLLMDDEGLIQRLLAEGFFLVRKERILISPSFDVDFVQTSKNCVQVHQLVANMQRKYGPIVRKPHSKKSQLTLSFGRIQDALRAVADSPHFNSKIKAVEPTHNRSFRPFAKHTDILQLLERAREAERDEAAANIRISRRTSATSTSSEASTSKKASRRRAGSDCSSSVAIEMGEEDGGSEGREKDDDVLRCSPVRIRDQDVSVRVRVADLEQWLPDRAAIIQHFEKYGPISFVSHDHHEGSIRFQHPTQMVAALQHRQVQVAGRWLELSPY